MSDNRMKKDIAMANGTHYSEQPKEAVSVEENKLYKIVTKLSEGFEAKYLTTIVYGTSKRVQDKRSEAIEKILSDHGSMHFGIHIKSEVTMMDDAVITQNDLTEVSDEKSR